MTSNNVPSQSIQVDIDRALFVRECAQCLLLDTTVSTTAIIICQRFFSLREWSLDDRIIGGASIFIATKSNEVPRPLRSIVNVLHAVMNRTTKPLGATGSSDGSDSRYAKLKNALINAEQTVLRVLRFEIDVIVPHPYLLNYTRRLDVDIKTLQCALALLNDVLCTRQSLTFPPFVLAASCLYVAMRTTNFKCTDDKWWYHYDTSDDDLHAIAELLQWVYEEKRTWTPNTALSQQNIDM